MVVATADEIQIHRCEFCRLRLQFRRAVGDAVLNEEVVAFHIAKAVELIAKGGFHAGIAASDHEPDAGRASLRFAVTASANKRKRRPTQHNVGSESRAWLSIPRR